MPETYDYIVCGGGTCGPVVAGRLSEDPNVKILLLEAGADSADMDNMHMPGAWTDLHYGPTDWNIVSPPQKGMNNRELRLPRGRFLGGSSGSNGTICVRGVNEDYDSWGFPEWSGQEMFRAMRKSETFRPRDWFPHDKDAHGYDGPLNIEPAAESFPLADHLFESFQDKGLPYIPDMFSSGVAANGCGHAMRTTYNGYRATAADFVTKSQQRQNVTIKCHAYVDKVVLEKGSDGVLQAKGVEYRDNVGNRYTANANREVLLAGGTYNSPTMLMRSGIGPKDVLLKAGVQCKLDLPGVGENLQDHQLIFTYYELSKPGLTDDERVNHDLNSKQSGHEQWLKDKTGWLATFPFGGFAFTRLSDRLDKEVPEWKALPRAEGKDPLGQTETQPSVEIFNTVCYGGPPEYSDKPKEGQYAFSMAVFLCGAASRGKVTIKTDDPFEIPVVDPNYFSDQRDLIMLAEGVRFANEVVMEGKGTKDIVKGSWPPGATHHKNKTNEDWREHVKKYASTSYHPGGTCKLGKKNDPMAVVDQYLQVYGTRSLRVIDCSIMPTLNSGHTQMPAYGIAEKAAEYVQQTWGSNTNVQARL